MPTTDVRHAEAVRRLFELMRRVNASVDKAGMLSEIAHGVVEVLGYGVAAIQEVQGDELVYTTVVGPPEACEAITGRRSSVCRLLDEFQQNAEEWGILRFVPHERMPGGEDALSWVPDLPATTAAEDWHPLDALYAPLYSATGEFLGSMAVDLPPGGKRPSQSDRELLEMFVVQAGLAISHALQRDRLDKEVKLGAVVRQVGEAGMLGSLELTLEEAGRRLSAGLDADESWIRVFVDGDLTQVANSVSFPAQHFTARPEVLEVKRRIAQRALARDEAACFHRGQELPDFSLEQGRSITSLMDRTDMATMVVAPVAVGVDLLGYVVLLRRAGRSAFDVLEREAAMETGRTLGRVVMNTRLFERERQLVHELQDLDRYRGELIATISHELKTPLTSIMGHVELLEDLQTGIDSVPAISRNAQRLDRLVENLLAYSQAQDRQEPTSQNVDLAELVENSVDLLALVAEQGQVCLETMLRREPVIVLGNPDDLAKVINNLLSNAVKYTRPGGRVRLDVTSEDTFAEVRCSDTGLGISASDMSNLFSAFHRSSNPDALSIPGTGLGLAISRRIARMHGGEILAESTLGRGSTFRLRLPLRDLHPGL